ncbi:hypothetical protein [Microbacterium sp. BH-3-3-3]|uniref:hypothetical protein n=1 Tax=Microbacterium sp. BH-3-3-3 TaxID=1906742 RepID=UPI0011A0BADD|nr:hypothetical protein [Microbacterium sp. BH-3-3-3]
MSVASTTLAPFACVACDREIAAKAFHVILTPHSALRRPAVSAPEREGEACVMVCGKCRELLDTHGRIFPECEASAHCDVYDHAQTLAADRRAAVAWLTLHDRMLPAASPVIEGEQS